MFFRAGADSVSGGGCDRACLSDRATFKNTGGTDDQGFQIGKACGIAGRAGGGGRGGVDVTAMG